MISYDQAKAKAVEKKQGLDSVLEYEDAWVFYSSKKRGTAAEDGEVVVLKENGQILSMSDYVISTNASAKARTVKF